MSVAHLRVESLADSLAHDVEEFARCVTPASLKELDAGLAQVAEDIGYIGGIVERASGANYDEDPDDVYATADAAMCWQIHAFADQMSDQIARLTEAKDALERASMTLWLNHTDLEVLPRPNVARR